MFMFFDPYRSHLAFSSHISLVTLAHKNITHLKNPQNTFQALWVFFFFLRLLLCFTTSALSQSETSIKNAALDAVNSVTDSINEACQQLPPASECNPGAKMLIGAEVLFVASSCLQESFLWVY